jgi:hypothetical protein
VFRQDSCGFELSNGFGIGSVLIDVYNTRGCFGDFLCLLLERVKDGRRKLKTIVNAIGGIVMIGINGSLLAVTHGLSLVFIKISVEAGGGIVVDSVRRLSE